MHTKELIEEYLAYVGDYSVFGDVILFYTDYLNLKPIYLLDYFYDLNNITNTEVSLFLLQYSGKHFQIKHMSDDTPFTNYSYIGQLE